MRAIRFPIAGLMGAVLVVALGLAALRNVSEDWAGIIFLLTCGALCLAVVGIGCRGDAERPWWLGFALFGWGYLILSIWSTVTLPTMTLLDAVAARLGAEIRFSGGVGGGSGIPPVHLAQEIAHSLWALVAALLGGVLSSFLFRGPRTLAALVDTPAQIATDKRRTWWLWPAAVGGTGVFLILILALTGSRSSPGFWVGATFLLTCALLGMTILGTVGGAGKHRQIWLGAAIFGISYMAMAFGRSLDRETWPSLPTDHLLQTLRPWFPPVVSGFPTSSDGVAAANARIWEALEKPVPMHFGEDTSLDEICKYVQYKTTGPDGKGIAIYIDPDGMATGEISMTSTFRNVELEGIPLKTSLRLCLQQLDMTYIIRDGILVITSEEFELPPVYQDPFLIVGHCVLALLAAGFGGIVAPFFWLRPTAHAAP